MTKKEIPFGVALLIIILFTCGLFFFLNYGRGEPPYGPSEGNRCAQNLRNLHLGALMYKSQFGGRLQRWSEKTGPEFWLVAWEKKLIDSPEVFICPFLKGRYPPGKTTYRGPKEEVSGAPSTRIIGCCVGHHYDGTMTVLYFDGSIRIVNQGDPEYKRALDETAGDTPGKK